MHVVGKKKQEKESNAMLFGTKGGNSSRDLANLMRYDESLRDHTREIRNVSYANVSPRMNH